MTTTERRTNSEPTTSKNFLGWGGKFLPARRKVFEVLELVNLASL